MLRACCGSWVEDLSPMFDLGAAAAALCAEHAVAALGKSLATLSEWSNGTPSSHYPVRAVG